MLLQYYYSVEISVHRQ